MTVPPASNTPEAHRIRTLILKEYRTWSTSEPRGDRAHTLRSLLWDIDHPADADQTDETWAAWLSEIEPRWASGAFVHPHWVAELQRPRHPTG